MALNLRTAVLDLTTKAVEPEAPAEVEAKSPEAAPAKSATTTTTKKSRSKK